MTELIQVKHETEEVVQAHISKLREEMRKEYLEQNKIIANLSNKCNLMIMEFKTLKANNSLKKEKKETSQSLTFPTTSARGPGRPKKVNR